MKPKISIIIPVFNRESLIKATINSIMEQSYRDFECLLIDDHSSDNTMDIMKKIVGDDLRFKILKRQSKYIKGPSGCRNMGLDIAHGEYIQFFDSDDLMHPDHLRLKMEACSKGADLVVCQLAEFKDDNISEIMSISNIDDHGDILTHVTGEVNYYLPGPLWKRDIIGNSRFDAEVQIYEDLLFNIENRIKCKSVSLIGKPLIFYRRHKKSTTGEEKESLKILNHKMTSWKKVYNTVEDLLTEKDKKKLKQDLFSKIFLNTYYFAKLHNCKGVKSGVKEMLKYGYNMSLHCLILLSILLAFIACSTGKGYRVYYKVYKKLKGNINV